MYDYLIVGSGLFGATFAHYAKQVGKKILVVEQREHIGGNCFTYEEKGIQIHKFGPHIFHTSSEKIWNFINQFAKFNQYQHHVKATHKNQVYSMPINMMTLHQIFGVSSPQEAEILLNAKKIPCSNPRNLEEWILGQVGSELYEKLIYGYTKKQWGMEPSQLPSSIIRRLPIRYTWDDNYFNDDYQGIPIGGYTQIFEQMFDGCEVLLGVDFFKEQALLESISSRILYTGMIDQFYNFCFGKLDYRTLKFENEHFSIPNFQGVSQMNYTALDVPFTRIIEHKHFESKTSPETIITREYPIPWLDGATPYYPINDEKNNGIYEKYRAISLLEERTIFGGRLSNYIYRDMAPTIASAQTLAKKEGLIL